MWFQDDFIMVVKIAFEISVNRCKTYTLQTIFLCIYAYTVTAKTLVLKVIIRSNFAT